LACFGKLSSIALAQLSQYFSIITAASVSYLTKLVAGSPHPTQNLEFFSVLDVNGSILFSVFSNNHIFSNYVENALNKLAGRFVPDELYRPWSVFKNSD